MKLSYETLLSDAPVHLNDIGDIRPIKVKDVMFSTGIGYDKYRQLLQLFIFSKEQIAECFYKPNIREKIVGNASLTTYDLLIMIPETRIMLEEALKFFFINGVVWVDKYNVFATKDKDDKVVGAIDRKNFENVRGVILPLNYIFPAKKKVQKFDSEETKKLWERAQKFQKQLANNNKKENDKANVFDLGNVVSKLCILVPSYNLFNVGELTIYQLYDQLFQYTLIRGADLSDQAFLRVGGDNHDFEAWLNPIHNN